ncbi:MAG: DUF5057 domain-containing protein [Lachnospiraceae bacterium]|nr:DUF5057 domain-containing protein [Lachnospiraceae bacterium]
MKRNKKLTILALSMMLVMTLAVTVISFTFADNDNNGAGTSTETTDVATGAALTNIDYIVKNSLDKDAEIYKIVEIGSKAVAIEDGESEPYTTFGEFAEKGGFKEYVINGNKTIDDVMPDDKINYVYYYAGAVTSDNTAALADIASADFIYISNDSSNPYTKTNDFGEDLYNLLHVYAVGDYKPIIIESPADSGSTDIGGGGSSGTGILFDNLAVDYFKAEGYLHNTYAWRTSVSATQFYAGNNSLFISISGRAKMGGWKNVKEDPAADTFEQMTEILVVSNGGGAIKAGTATRFELALDGATSVTTLSEIDATNVAKEIELKANQSLYNIKNTALYTTGYSAKYSAYKPEYALVSEISFADLQKDTTFDYSKYDLVIFEDDLKGKDLSDTEFYKRLVGAMYSKVHIIFGDIYTVSNNVNNGSGNLNVGDSTKTNYHELFYMVATEDGVERYPNVMVTTKAEMEIIMSSNNAGTCKVIADIINGGSYRGIGGPGSTSTMFTVLEIQPCYPIDTTIAAAKKGYYSTPSEMINGKTREQLGLKLDANGNTVVVNADGTTSAVDADTIEYYAWELSEAKIADALNMDVRQIKVVHMSSEEFATNKDEVLGNYDMVYIGGNTSALKPLNEWRSIGAFADFGFKMETANNKEILPVYTMYTNVGDMMRNVLDVEEGPVSSGTTFNAAPGHTSSETFVTLNGNDITYNGLEELKAFVAAGMPVIISDDVKAAYDPIKANIAAKKSPYLQNQISPDSNMYDFLLYCDNYDDDTTKVNVIWGFDKDSIDYVDNDGGALGDTLTGEVEVFAGDVNDDVHTDAKSVLYDLYNNAKTSKRPKLAVTSMPAVYNVYDPSTKTKTLSLAYKFDVVGTNNYEVKLYADYSKNSMFEESEIIASGDSVKEITANLATIEKYGSGYSGPVYWKLEIVDKASGASVSTAKLAYVETSDSTKKTVRVLQILPDKTSEKAYSYKEGGNTWVNLIFCTECQRAIEILDRNPWYGEQFLNNDKTNLYDGKISDDRLDANGCAIGIYTGKHEHNFGIVRYDSATGMDDWYYNYADDVSDMFDFNIDIMDSREFEEASQAVIDEFNAYVATNHPELDVANLTDEQIELLKSELRDVANVAKDAYDAQVKFEDFFEENYPGRQFVNLSTEELASIETALTGYDLALAEFNLKKFVLSIKDSTGNDYANKAFNNIYKSGQYEDYVLYIRELNNMPAYWHYDEYKALYETYAHALDVRIDLEKEYEEANRVANFDNWLFGCYETVVIGPAESFCGDDIETEVALKALTDYIDAGGSMLMFHDTLTKYSDNGAHKLTAALIDKYGMDKNHMELDASLAGTSQKVTVETKDYIIGNDKENGSIKVNNKDFNLQLSSKYDTISFAVNLTGDMNINNVTFGGNRIAAGENIEYSITVYSSNGNLLKNGNVTAVIHGNTYTGTTDENGIVKFDVPNYTVRTEEKTYTANDIWFLPYKLKDGYSSTEYNLINLSHKPTTDTSRFFTWKDDMGTVHASASSQAKYKYYSPIYAFTDAMNLGHNDNRPYSPYKYASVNIKALTANGYTALPANLGSNKASKTNKGIMTMFPFNLSDELNIAPTHPQAYALDLQNDNLSVWYTIAGGSNNKAGSELQAATPHDGTDNYFIYSIGNLNYCSAGHTRVTGQLKENNDERMLYINVICNSVTNVPVTEITAFDYSSTDDNRTNNVVKKYGSEYVMKLDESVTRPFFSFDFTLGNGVTLKDIKVYYELDNVLGCGENDKLIKKYGSNEVTSGKLTFVPKDSTTGEDYDNLLIDPSYLTNGKYVYIVIQLTDSNGNKTYKKIKVEYKDKLYNLT